MGKWYTRPVLFVSDVERSSQFYVDKLGYREEWRYGDEGRPYVAQVERAGSELILSSQWPDKVGSALTFISLDPDELRSDGLAREGALLRKEKLKVPIEILGAAEEVVARS